MFDSMLLFVAGMVFSWPALVVLFLVGSWFEYAEARGAAVFLALVAALIVYIHFDVPLIVIGELVGLYLIVGLISSFLQYRQHAFKIIRDLNNESTISDVAWKSSMRESTLRGLKPSNMWSTLVSWIVIWPFSIGTNVINGLKYLVEKVFHGVYEKIYQLALKELK